jgi:hypothetical protein
VVEVVVADGDDVDVLVGRGVADVLVGVGEDDDSSRAFDGEHGVAIIRDPDLPRGGLHRRGGGVSRDRSSLLAISAAARRQRGRSED